MTYKITNTSGGGPRESIGRRKVLASLAAAGAGGLAGCPDVTVNIGDGGGDGGGGSGDGSGSDGSGSDGGDGASGDLSCTDVTNGYELQDVGPRPVLFDFEYPAIFDELEYIKAGPLVSYEAQQPTGDDGQIDIYIAQTTDPEGSVGATEQGTSGTTMTFNGEEVEFAGSSTGSGLLWGGDLPYQFDGERRTFPTLVEMSAAAESNDCGDALREAADHLVNSMELNDETTL